MFTCVRRAAFVVLVAAMTMAGPAGVAAARSGWAPTGSMTAMRARAATALLPDGRVLVAGGIGASSPIAAAELYDPASGTWSATGSMVTPRAEATATVLPDGRVLVAGGNDGPSVLAGAELYDPSTGSWSRAASMGTARYGHAAVLLADGRVLVVGGVAAFFGSAASSAEIYDPATDAWTAAGSMSAGREYATAARLPDGDVLVAGGDASGGALAVSASADRYHPATGTWLTVAAMSTARTQAGTATAADGRVLVLGGTTESGFTRSVEAYDPSADVWTAGGSLSFDSNVDETAGLDDGRVLVAGERSTTTDLYDPAAATISASYALSTQRGLPALTRLRDGRVLVAGGHGLSSAEVFTPPTSRDAPAVDFGTTPVGSAVERDVRVSDSGGNGLWIDGVAVDGTDDFAIVSDGCGATRLAAGDDCTVRVRFTPSVPGAGDARLVFDDNAEDSPPTALTGAGTTSPPADGGDAPPPTTVPPPPAAPTPGPLVIAPPPPGPPTPPAACTSRRRLVVHATLPRHIRSGTATLNGKRVARLRRGQRRVVVDLRGKRAGTYTLRLRIRTTNGRVRTITHRYRTCGTHAD